MVLEPNKNPFASAYQKGIFNRGIPITAFWVDDIQSEYERLITLGVKFTVTPSKGGDVIIAVFDDTSSNPIQIYEFDEAV